MRINTFSVTFLVFAFLCSFTLMVEVKAYNPASGPVFGASRHTISLRATNEILMACDRAMSVPVAYLFPKTDRLQTATSCNIIAIDTFTRMPTHGFAYYVAALAEHHLNNTNARNDMLARSVALAPFEGWLAERRFVLAINGDTAVNTATEADISTLLTTQSGAELLANYLVQRPETDKMIFRVAASSSVQNQTRLSNILTRKRAAK